MRNPGGRSRWRSSASGSGARLPPSRSSILPESGSGAEPSLRAGRSRRGRLALAELPLDPCELRFVALADRALEPLVGRDYPPTAEEQERRADHDRRVVERAPEEGRLPRRAVVESRQHEHDADGAYPQHRDAVEPLVLLAHWPGATIELFARAVP